jgi:hypothetical protein
MLQVIYGIAPKAKLCFASDETGSFADALASLTSATGPCQANVIIGDSFAGEGSVIFAGSVGAFSEGSDSAAINQAVAAGVTVVIAAGDLGPGVYNGTFKAVSDAAARAGTFGNLKLSQVPTALTAGGFHDFSTTGTPQLAYSVSTSGTTVHALDWDDIATSFSSSATYNFLVFDKDGNYFKDSSGINNAFGAGPNSEFAFLGDTNQVAISLAAPATGATPTRLRITSDTGTTDITVTGLPAAPAGPSLYGTAAAAGAISVSSYSKDNLAKPDAYNSCGPFTEVFDSSGNRLATPETRLKPDVAGVDGVDATFFPGVFSPAAEFDTDNDGFANVPGSSISAAAVGAVAALAIQASGGTATPAQVSTWLRQAASHASTWAPSDGYGLIDAVGATTLGAGGSLTAGADAGTSIGALVDAGAIDPGSSSKISSGCGSAGPTGVLWMLLACALLAAARARRRGLSPVRK